MAKLVGDQLALFLAAHNCRPWQPGQVDCCLFLADWAMWLGHPDPAAHLRGTYDSDEGFRSIIAAAGGVSPVVAACVASIGGKSLIDSAQGAVGVIGSRSNINRQWGAIFDGTSWLVRTRNGACPIAAATLAIWEI
ncbi:hypothetical protein ELH33_15355 [Rhizobium ruizarguesonis]|uniref:DUF6950 family protein n=1 Tax=Rhizobium ruizarguesonis TaxID=2081791 RepID=UPI001031F48A|nr:hypothetical protein [Rhizobium ruizarguesonis]TBC36403.1 hypothetical protein ELH33_15355 [Rhizobium ruizarguesonis]